MSFEYSVDNRKSFVIIFLIVLTIGFFINANIDPEAQTTDLNLQLTQDWYYYNEILDVYRGTIIDFEIESLSTINVVVIKDNFFPENNLQHIVDLSHDSSSRKNFTSSTKISFTTDSNSLFRVFIFDLNSPVSAFTLTMTIDSPAFSTTTTFTIFTFFIGLIWLTVLLALYKDIRYLWFFFKQEWFGIRIEKKDYSDEDDMLDDLFGRQNNLKDISDQVSEDTEHE